MLDQEHLKQMVLKVIQQLEEESLLPLSKQKACYLILPECWQDDYFTRLGDLLIPADFQVISVLPKVHYNDFYIQKLKEIFPSGLVIEQVQALNETREESLTIIPFPSRALVAKTALCIEDTFETKWISWCFSQGQKIVMLQSGMEPLSGKEPEAYRMKIEHYIRTLSDFGIEQSISFLQIEQPKVKLEEIMQPKKRIITEADVVTYQKNGRLTLQDGDIITLLAREKANEIGIQVEKV